MSRRVPCLASRRVLFLAVSLATALALGPSLATAQLAHASASTLGLAGNQTATARGFAAISVNPAGLAMPGSGFSLALAPVKVRLGLAPVSFGELFYDYGGVRVPDGVKGEWLERIVAEGGETGSSGVETSGFALTVGSLGIQVSTVASVDVNLPPGAAEAMLFGNAGRTGAPTDLDLVGATVDAFAATTLGVSYGMRAGPSAVGVTAKYTQGHVLAYARSVGGGFATDPLSLNVEFPMVSTCAEDEAQPGACERDLVNGGRGFGLDVGWMMDLPAVRLGASITNLLNTFSWETEKLGFRPGTALLDRDESETAFDEEPFDAAPEEVRAAVQDLTFKPRLNLGAALDVTPVFTVSADIQRTLVEGGLALAPRTHAGVGADFRGLGFLHLQGGFAAVTGGVQYGGGAALVIGALNVSAAAAKRTGSGDDSILLQFGLSLGNR